MGDGLTRSFNSFWLVTPYGNIDLAWRHQSITRTNAELSSNVLWTIYPGE